MSWQACDGQWASGVLPTAASGALLYCLLIPCGFLWALVRSRDPDSAAWQWYAVVLSGFTSTYQERVRWWEMVVLVRRLALIAVVALVPYYSQFLPASLFVVIQVSALAQHVYHPYRESFDNRAELASLYLLLGSYVAGFINAVLGSAGVADPSMVLLVLNLVFVAVMLLRVGRGMLPGRLASLLRPGAAQPQVSMRLLPGDEANGGDLDPF